MPWGGACGEGEELRIRVVGPGWKRKKRWTDKSDKDFEFVFFVEPPPTFFLIEKIMHAHSKKKKKNNNFKEHKRVHNKK